MTYLPTIWTLTYKTIINIQTTSSILTRVTCTFVFYQQKFHSSYCSCKICYSSIKPLQSSRNSDWKFRVASLIRYVVTFIQSAFKSFYLRTESLNVIFVNCQYFVYFLGLNYNKTLQNIKPFQNINVLTLFKVSIIFSSFTRNFSA